MAWPDGVMFAVTTLLVTRQSMVERVSGEKVTVQPVGGVAVSFTAVRSAVPEFWTWSWNGIAPPAVPSAFRRWSGVVRAIEYGPMIATCRGASTSWPPSVALTTMG